MARPGFNATHWSELPLDEGVLLGWLGQYSHGPAPLSSFRKHLEVYAPKVFPFFRLDHESGSNRLRVFDSDSGFIEVMTRLSERTQSIRDFSLEKDQVSFSINESRLLEEVENLKERGVRRIVSLTEHHHQKDFLSGHFQLNHLAIEDLGAPTKEQAHKLAEILKASRRDHETLAVHCLAGIGRTSTMLIAAHLLLGEDFCELKTQIAEKNPTFALVGSQAEFLHNLADTK
jgi:hypothetical protein